MPKQAFLPLPQNLPVKTRCLTIEIPDDDEYQVIFASMIKMLSVWDAWDRDATRKGKLVARLWLKALNSIQQCKPEITPTGFGIEDDMPFFRLACEGDKCFLEFECCPGEWVRLANVDQITQPNQQTDIPQPAPGGGTQQYCTKLDAKGQYRPSVLVSAGDTITLDSFSGAGSDDTNPLEQWYCFDGQQYFGVCGAAPGHLEGTDPLPTANHMSGIVNIAGTWHSLIGGAVTVPSGVSNAPIVIQVNDSDLSNNPGDYQICVTVKNNQTATWSHIFDFTINSYGWLAWSGETGSVTTWVGGIGWQGNIYNPSGVAENTASRIEKLASTTINYIRVKGKMPNNRAWDHGGSVALLNGATLIENLALTEGLQTFDIQQSFADTAFTDIKIQAAFGYEVDIPNVQAVISYLELHGTGVDPF